MLIYAFGHTAGLNQAGLVKLNHLGFQNFYQALRYPAGQVLVVSLENAVLATTLCGLIAYPVAYFIARRLGPRTRVLVLLLVVLPFWTDYLLRMLGWRIFLSPLGLLYNAMHAVGWHVTYVSLLDTRTAVMIGLVYNYVPLFILPLAVVLERIDPAADASRRRPRGQAVDDLSHRHLPDVDARGRGGDGAGLRAPAGRLRDPHADGRGPRAHDRQPRGVGVQRGSELVPRRRDGHLADLDPGGDRRPSWLLATGTRYLFSRSRRRSIERGWAAT